MYESSCEGQLRIHDFTSLFDLSLPSEVSFPLGNPEGCVQALSALLDVRNVRNA